MVTDVPPASGPAAGLMPVTVGADVYVNLSAAEVAVVPPGAVTVMSTAPAAPAGLVATTWVAVSLTIAPGTDPKSTAVALARLVPVMVTDVPPASGPAAGLMPVTVGGR